MQRKQHPNHHLPPILIGAASVLGLVGMAAILGFVLKDNWALLLTIVGGLAVAETLTVILVTSQLLKRAQCPNCHAELVRDPEQAGFQFACNACDTVWVSKLGGGMVER